MNVHLSLTHIMHANYVQELCKGVANEFTTNAQKLKAKENPLSLESFTAELTQHFYFPSFTFYIWLVLIEIY